MQYQALPLAWLMHRILAEGPATGRFAGRVQ
jgi:hypothetical protein